MEFLGNLGIDIKLLVAQIINFGLLLWLLTKFLYKPTVKRIEEDEKELEEAKIQKEKLAQEKEIYIKQKSDETLKTKKRTREIIREAENIAKEIKEEMREDTNKESLAIISQSKNKIKNLKPEIEKKILNNIQANIGSSFQSSFLSALPISSQKELQNILWKDFVKQIEPLVSEKLGDSVLFEISEKLKIAVKEKNNEKDILKKRLDEILAQKIGTIILEYAYPLTEEQSQEFEEIISGKNKIKLQVTKRQNKNLINGFSLEIAGIIVENNLLNIVNNAADFKYH